MPFYGGDGTIHHTGHLNVEIHKGRVVAVWFRCLMLPFEVHEVDEHRAAEMIAADDDWRVSVEGVEFENYG